MAKSKPKKVTKATKNIKGIGKVNLAKEAAKLQDAPTKDGIITQQILVEFCPKQFMTEFKKCKTQAQRADFLFKVNAAGLAIKKGAEDINKFQFRLERWFIQELPITDATGVAGKVARVQVQRKDRPSVKDWPKLYAYIKKNSAFELLNRAVNKKAVKERWEANKQIPGVERFEYRAISLTKVKK